MAVFKAFPAVIEDTMSTSAIRPAVLALVVVLAGCSGFSGGPTASPTGATDGPTASTQPTDGSGSTDVGTVRFYLSDQPSIIDEFRHLNATITRIGFHRGGGNGSWIEFPVNGTTVDLTALKGANATLIEEFDLPAGNYTKVFVYVESVDGTLKTGDNMTVKLPSGKLQLNKGFRLGPNESVEFVYDISVHKAGQSGKYILKPVIGESGTDVPIEPVDRDNDRDRDRTRLEAAVVGNVTAGQPVTVSVTRNGSAVPNATVFVDGQRVGTTDAQGRIEVEVPADADELTVTIRAGDAETELELEIDGEDEGGPPDGQGQGNGGGN